MMGTRLNAVIALLAASGLPDPASARVLINDCCGGAEDYVLSPDAINQTGPSVVAFGTGDGVCCYIEAGLSHAVPYPIFSASKLVSGYVMWSLIEEGLLSLDTHPGDVLDWWTTDPADKRSAVTVSDLMTMSDGMGSFANGIGTCTADTVLGCAQEAYNIAFDNHERYPLTGAPEEGEDKFHYGETKWFVLGAMAMQVTGLPTYNEVFHAKLGNRLGITANCTFSYPSIASALPGGGLVCSMDDYHKFLIAVFTKTVVSADLVDFAEMPATMLKGIEHDSWNPDMVWAEYLYYGHGQWVECAARGCTGAPRKISSKGALGWYPYVWRNGTESHWGTLGHVLLGAGQPLASLDNPMWGYAATKSQFRNTFPKVKAAIAEIHGGAPHPPATPIAGTAYVSVGGAGVVAVDEGATVGAYKEDCTADPLDTCFQATPDLGFCEEQCAKSGACNSFAFCTGNTAAPFPRCYLKTKHIDLQVKPHGGGDCTTFLASGNRLGSRFGTVARNEGANLATFKADCEAGNEHDFCFPENYTFYDCVAACDRQDGCGSFAFCTGIGNPGTDLQRCYLKTASFATVEHAGGDCATFYPSESASCKDVKNYFKEQACCGAPHKELDMNKAKTGGVQEF